MAEEHPDDRDRRLERFRRWQKIAIDQLGYANNLTLTLTVATLGYWFVLLADKGFVPGSSAKCAMILSLISLALAAACGSYCVVNRLWDFNGSAQRALHAEDAPSKKKLDALGVMTRVLFYSQLGTFALGVTALATALLLTYGGKLA